MSNAPRRGRDRWLGQIAQATSPQDLYRRLIGAVYNRPKMQEPKKKVRMVRSDGPLLFLADQVVKRMARAGWPCFVHSGYRTAEEQNALFNKRVNGKRVTNARAYQSAHNYYMGADIVHKSLFWNAPPEFWETLSIVVRQVADEYGVDINHGHNWKFVDSAHIELRDWRKFKKAIGEREPTRAELLAEFRRVLPQVVKSWSA